MGRWKQHRFEERVQGFLQGGGHPESWGAAEQLIPGIPWDMLLFDSW